MRMGMGLGMGVGGRVGSTRAHRKDRGRRLSRRELGVLRTGLASQARTPSGAGGRQHGDTGTGSLHGRDRDFDPDHS